MVRHDWMSDELMSDLAGGELCIAESRSGLVVSLNEFKLIYRLSADV